MFFVNKIRWATICHSSLSISRQGLVTGIPSSRQKRRKDLITDKENELVMEMYASLKRGDFKEHQKLKEDKRLSRRQRKRIKDEAIDRIVSSPLSNRMIEPTAIDENALDCIVEMGMLIKIFHLGLIDENVFVKTKDDVLKRHSATHSILSLVEG